MPAGRAPAAEPGQAQRRLSRGLDGSLLEQLLWVDDPPSVAELCRCLAALLADGNAYFYVCGLKSMEEGVLMALRDVAQQPERSRPALPSRRLLSWKHLPWPSCPDLLSATHGRPLWPAPAQRSLFSCLTAGATSCITWPPPMHPRQAWP